SRAPPSAEVLEHRFMGGVLSVERRPSLRVIELSHTPGCECPERYRVVRGAESGGADVGDWHLGELGQNPERVHVARFALIDRHAGRGVALDVLDGAEVLTHGELQLR